MFMTEECQWAAVFGHLRDVYLIYLLGLDWRDRYVFANITDKKPHYGKNMRVIKCSKIIDILKPLKFFAKRRRHSFHLILKKCQHLNTGMITTLVSFISTTTTLFSWQTVRNSAWKLDDYFDYQLFVYIFWLSAVCLLFWFSTVHS